MISYITQALRNWRDRDLIAAERERNFVARQIAYRQAHNMEWKPLQGVLLKATNASLRASIGRSA
ncbi:MAG: hypothetical protein ACTHJQ_12550 [Rhizobiaceae bacterium]